MLSNTRAFLLASLTRLRMQAQRATLKAAIIPCSTAKN